MEIRGKRIAQISLGALDYDTRVNRAIETLRAAGAEVSVIAPGALLPAFPMSNTRKIRIGLLFPILSCLGIAGSKAAFWSFRYHRKALKKLLNCKPQVIHAHDWDGLVIGATAAEQLDIPLIYDSHELATEMHRERRLWRWTMPRAIRSLEGNAIKSAMQVITVSRGIADYLHKIYGLENRPLVVRNLPLYEDHTERGDDTGSEQILLHYHGILAEGRGLEAVVLALAELPPQYGLQLIGPERQRGFLGKIQHLAEAVGVGDRINIKPALPPGDLIKQSRSADIGLCILDKVSNHNRYALPNKIFEYIMAGLYVLASAGPDVGAIIGDHSAGSTLSNTNPGSIADAIRKVGRTELKEARQRNLQLAKTLCWEKEKAELLDAYNKI